MLDRLSVLPAVRQDPSHVTVQHRGPREFFDQLFQNSRGLRSLGPARPNRWPREWSPTPARPLRPESGSFLFSLPAPFQRSRPRSPVAENDQTSAPASPRSVTSRSPGLAPLHP